MAYQFVHVSTYARDKPKKRGRGKDRKWTVRDIAGEVERDPEHSPHVTKPLPPTVVFGVGASEAVAEAERRSEASTDVSGRKVRKDTPILLAGVASHPATIDQLANPVTKREYERWQHDALEWMKGKYGGNLLSVVEHTDERHPHLHFYVVPDAGKGFNAKSLHDGFRAAAGVKTGPEQKRLYCEGMRRLQDDFFAQVGAKHAQARIGPRKRRLTRSQWIQEQQQLIQLAKLMKAGKATLGKAQKQASLIVEKAHADAQKTGIKLGGFFGGLAGRASDALKRLERERDEERKRVKAEKEQRIRAEERAEDARRQLVHEHLTSDQKVDNLVKMKTLPLQKQLELEQRKNNELMHQLDSLASENNSFKQKLDRRGLGLTN